MANPAEVTASTSTPDAIPASVDASKMFGDMAMLLALMFAVFYFMLIRPQQRKQKEHKAMMDALEKGQKVIVAGGIIGEVVKLEGDDVVVVEVAENTRIRVPRICVNEVLNGTKPTAASAPTAKAANDK